ncbi:GntR family transcriptional regulator [Pseudoxanthomonas composti]|uniref:GntR family transcriptional regulator n=1 Tax=Pseudoxanthomonas composti TaxID=2137479 RepID=A0A4Q1JWS2_9GAMM|nr:GntR family transcriptional regulator [Pseudoxanthomonas composti]RXR07056.1 GntR family transcriptional regulator [Pseudoxanthomonas composti]
MGTSHSKKALVYGQVRRDLQSGRYPPGQRIDPATLARELKVSQTPVRAALHHLVGEGVIIDHARSGLQVPLLNEVALHELYDLMERLLLMACDIGFNATVRRPSAFELLAHDIDVPKSTWQLFNAIALSSGHRLLHQTIKRHNDRLAPIRRAKSGLLDHALEELTELSALWQRQESEALRDAIRAYHARRKQLVPRIVALLIDRRDGVP